MISGKVINSEREIGMGQKLIELWEFHSDTVLSFAVNIGTAIAILLTGIILSRGLQKLVRRAAAKGLRSDEAVTTLLRTVVRYGIIIICAIMILNVFGVNTASLLAVLGVAGVAIGLALKDILSNIVSGIILLFLGSYRKEEFIEFGDFSGTVKDMNLFTTILETPDGIYVSAPNSSIWNGPLRNYTRNGKRRLELSFGIARTDSFDTAFQTMQNIINAEPRILKDPAPGIILQSIEDNSLKIAVRAWVPVQDYWSVYWDMSKTIQNQIEASGLHIPCREVHIVQ